MAGEAYDGPPTFALMIGGEVIGSGALNKAVRTETDGRLFTKPRPSQFLEQFSFVVPDSSVLPGAEIAVILTNDKFTEQPEAGTAFDRNLFVDFVSVNGREVNGADLAVIREGEVQHFDYQAGLLPLYEAGYQVVARPPIEGWPSAVAKVSSSSTSARGGKLAPIPVLASLSRN